jgi:hypothetical protein
MLLLRSLSRFGPRSVLIFAMLFFVRQPLVRASVPILTGEALSTSQRPDVEGLGTVETPVVYLPFLLNGAYPGLLPGIHGRVNYQGAPAPDIPLGLLFYNGSIWSPLATTTTGSDGRYRFADVPALGSDQKYEVHYGRNETDPRYLAHWYGPEITIYTAGADMSGGDFDIANVSLLSPGLGAVRALPITFEWEQRGIRGDSYDIMLYDTAGPFLWFSSTDTGLGDVGSYMLDALPPGAVYDREYRWQVVIRNSSNGFGSSYYYRRITLTAGASQEPGLTPNPVSVDQWSAKGARDVFSAVEER